MQKIIDRLIKHGESTQADIGVTNDELQAAIETGLIVKNGDLYKIHDFEQKLYTQIRRPGCAAWAVGYWTLEKAQKELDNANQCCPGHIIVREYGKPNL